jgi:hypothetical protein
MILKEKGLSPDHTLGTSGIPLRSQGTQGKSLKNWFNHRGHEDTESIRRACEMDFYSRPLIGFAQAAKTQRANAGGETFCRFEGPSHANPLVHGIWMILSLSSIRSPRLCHPERM